MGSFDFVNLAVLVLAVGGLAAVLLETLMKSPASLVAMADDSRRFAEASLVEETVSAHVGPVQAQAPANVNQPRLAA